MKSGLVCQTVKGNRRSLRANSYLEEQTPCQRATSFREANRKSRPRAALLFLVLWWLKVWFVVIFFILVRFKNRK